MVGVSTIRPLIFDRIWILFTLPESLHIYLKSTKIFVGYSVVEHVRLQKSFFLSKLVVEGLFLEVSVFTTYLKGLYIQKVERVERERESKTERVYVCVRMCVHLNDFFWLFNIRLFRRNYLNTGRCNTYERRSTSVKPCYTGKKKKKNTSLPLTFSSEKTVLQWYSSLIDYLNL